MKPHAYQFDQAGQIARAFPRHYAAFGENRPFRNGMYGNMTLTRLPLKRWKNFDVSRRGRERRGILETEVEVGDSTTLHVFNVHLGTGHMERRYQGRLLVNGRILENPDVKGPRLVIGDFNEWTRGVTTRLLRTSIQDLPATACGPLSAHLPRHTAVAQPRPLLLRTTAVPGCHHASGARARRWLHPIICR